MYTAETYSIFEALKSASSPNSDSFATISDSLSALKSILNPYSKNELVQYIQELISLYQQSIKHSHIGVFGNETADKFANESSLPHNALKLVSRQNVTKTKVSQVVIIYRHSHQFGSQFRFLFGR